MNTRLPCLPCLHAIALTVWLGACAAPGPDEAAGTARPATVFAVTQAQELIRFNAGTPRRIEQRQPLVGLAPGETVLGIDFRVSHGVLYGLTSAGKLVTIDTASARATAVGAGPGAALQGERFGVDFNPAADRLRVVSDSGQNLRFHPETGALAATDPALVAATTGLTALRLAGAAYTYNKKNEKLTTNYALDIGRGWLVTQGSIEGVEPVVSPNTGRIFDVGPLGTGPVDDAAFDIADTDNTALAALRSRGHTRLYAIDLGSGRARLLGRIGDGSALRGIAIQP